MRTETDLPGTAVGPVTLFERLKGFVADVLFPRACIGCGGSDTFLCETCLSAVPRKRTHDCPVCRRVRTPDGETCLSCRKRSALDGVFAPSVFQEHRIVSSAIHVLKYEFVPEIAEPLGRFLAERARDTDLPIPDIVVPVPLHPWRLRYRGFNQSALIAESLATSFIPGFPVPVREDIVIRTRFTLPQAKSRGASERRENLRRAFSLAPETPDVKRTLRRKVIWLIDDVATTGATLEECAKTLKKAGAKKVFGIVVAR